MILAIDLGRHLGWFKANAVGPAEYGTFLLADTTDLGMFLRSACDPLRRIMPGVTHLAIEKPNTAGKSAYYAIRKNMALLAICHYWRTYHPAITGVEEISVAQAKLTLAGHGHADKSMMIAAAAEHGFPGMDEHQADAYGIWRVSVFGPALPKRSKPKNGPVTIIKPGDA